MTLLAYGSERTHWQQSRMMNTFISLSIPAPHCQQGNTELQLVGFSEVSRTASNLIRWLNIYNTVCSVYLHSIISDLEKMPVQLHIILIFRGITLSLSVGRKMYGSSAPLILQHTILYPTMAKQEWHLFHQVIRPVLVFLITTALWLLLSLLKLFMENTISEATGTMGSTPSADTFTCLPVHMVLQWGFKVVPLWGVDSPLYHPGLCCRISRSPCKIPLT